MDRRPLPPWHLLPTILLVAVLTFALVSVLSTAGRITARVSGAWRSLNADNDVESAEYNLTPGCWDRAEKTDPSLAPCRDVSAKVLAKERRSVHGGDGRGNKWVHHLNSLTLQDESGRVRKLHDIRDLLYDAVSVGGVVQARVWRGRITELSAQRERSGTSETPGMRMVPNGGLFAGGATPAEQGRVYLWGGVSVAALIALIVLRLLVLLQAGRRAEEGTGLRDE